jgi:hypothetical protein
LAGLLQATGDVLSHTNKKVTYFICTDKKTYTTPPLQKESVGYITGVEKLKSLNVSPARLKVSDKSSTSILKSSITKHRDSLPPRCRERELTVA